MTLIVGVRCTGGVVLGADGAATLADPLGMGTVIQPVRKLRVFDATVIMGASGPMSLVQLYCDRVEVLWKKRKPGRNRSTSLPDVQRQIYDAISKDAAKALRDAETMSKVLGANAAAMLASTSSLIALPVAGQAELIECDYTGKPEAKSDDLPYAAIGSGQRLADPFLAFLRRMFWADQPPTLSQGLLAAVWTLEHAIRVNTGGVSHPIQLATLTENPEGDMDARLLSSEDIDEHLQSVDAIEEYISAYPGPVGRVTSNPPL